MKKKYIAVIPGNIKGADNAHTDLLSLFGVSVNPIDPKFCDGYDDPVVAAVEVDGKLYDLKAALTAFAGQIVPVAIDDPQDGDILVYDAESGKFKNVATEEN